MVLNTNSIPAPELEELYAGQVTLSSAQSVFGSPVRTKDIRYFCIATATVASTVVEPPIPPPAPPGPAAVVELDEEELADGVALDVVVELEVVVEVEVLEERV